ncbi:MAG: hypothetical protein ACKO4A_18355, partial [Gammaproteobacteria bacterium]
MRDLATRELQAAYVRIDAGLSPVSVVLFRIPFDTDGFPDQHWNVPLRQLAEIGARGPDLGGGPTRLATRSQCPLPGQEAGLWDVEFGAGGNTLELIRERLRINRLGLDASEMRAQAAPLVSPPIAAPAQPQASASQGAAPAITASSDAMLALMQQSNQQIAMIKEQSQREILSMQERLLESHQRVQALEAERQRLQEQLADQLRNSADEHARAEKKLQTTVDKARAQHLALRKELEGEFEEVLSARERSAAEELAALVQTHGAALEALERRLASEIATLEAARAADAGQQREELAAQEEQLHNMRSELTELRRDKLRLMGEGADKFFEALREKGIKLVSFQPGAGHLTIPVEELGRFLEDSDAFVAAKCGVGVEHYRRWLAHYGNPVCQGASGSGAPCAKPLQKMLKPADFVAGLHDRCDIHKQVPRSQTLQDRSA